MRSTSEHKNKGLLLFLGDLAPGTIISETKLADMLGKHIETIRRWRRKNILPDSISLGQNRVWTVQCLLDHLSSRLSNVAEQRRLTQKRIAHLSPVKG